MVYSKCASKTILNCSPTYYSASNDSNDKFDWEPKARREKNRIEK